MAGTSHFTSNWEPFKLALALFTTMESNSGVAGWLVIVIGTVVPLALKGIRLARVVPSGSATQSLPKN